MSAPEETANPAAADAAGTPPVEPGSPGLKQRKSKKDGDGKEKKSRKDSDSKKSRKKSEQKAEALRYANMPPAIHRGYVCDKCNMTPILGIRYTKKRDNYDLCETCFEKSIDDEKKKKFIANYRPEGYDPVEVKHPFMGWDGWPPLWVVIVFFILFAIVQVAFMYLFFQFWTSGPEDETEKYFNCSYAQEVRPAPGEFSSARAARRPCFAPPSFVRARGRVHPLAPAASPPRRPSPLDLCVQEIDVCMKGAWEKNLTRENHEEKDGEEEDTFRCPIGCQGKLDHAYGICDRFFSGEKNWTEKGGLLGANVSEYGCSRGFASQIVPVVRLLLPSSCIQLPRLESARAGEGGRCPNVGADSRATADAGDGGVCFGKRLFCLAIRVALLLVGRGGGHGWMSLSPCAP